MRHFNSGCSCLTGIALNSMFLFFLISCGVGKDSIETGQIVTPGVEIRAVDGSFTLKSGERWEPPFESITDWDDQGEMYREGATGKYDFALNDLRAKKVMVKTPYLEKELYGVLLLNKAMGDCNSPVTRSYQISIPESYAKMALNGQVSVVYEYYSCGDNPAIKTWILWLSDVPF